jgi:hypothetical protein
MGTQDLTHKQYKLKEQKFQQYKKNHRWLESPAAPT